MDKIRSILATAAVSLVALGIAGAAQAAPVFTNPANGHQYTLTDPKSWLDAQADAVALGGNLVTINDAGEQQWLGATFGGYPNRFWIGYTDQDQEGTWTWISGEPVTFINWAASEPNDLKDEDYAVMNWVIGGAWNDWRGHYSAAGIIEIQEVSEPLPLALLGMGLLGMAAIQRRRQRI